MKKILLITLTVAGGLFVKTLTPDRQDRDNKQAVPCSSKYNSKKTVQLYDAQQTKVILPA